MAPSLHLPTPSTQESSLPHFGQGSTAHLDQVQLQVPVSCTSITLLHKCAGSERQRTVGSSRRKALSAFHQCYQLHLQSKSVHACVGQDFIPSFPSYQYFPGGTASLWSHRIPDLFFCLLVNWLIDVRGECLAKAAEDVHCLLCHLLQQQLEIRDSPHMMFRQQSNTVKGVEYLDFLQLLLISWKNIIFVKWGK